MANERGAAVKCSLLVCAVLGFAVQPGVADVLNMGTGLTSLETVPVGDAGNVQDTRYGRGYTKRPEDPVGYGQVNYDYRIGKYEVTAGQYTEFLNKVAGVDTYGLYNPNMWSYVGGCKIERFAGKGTTASPYQYRVAADRANRPVNCVGFWDACRFANWLHNGQPSGVQDNSTTEDGAYTLTPEGVANNTVTRNGNWQWAITSVDEWYKAAYYKGGSPQNDYWNYPTASNSPPSHLLKTPDGGNNANFDYYGYTIGSPYYLTPVGEFELSESPYGTFDQGGNVGEWTDGVAYGLYRGIQGGSAFSDVGPLHAMARNGGGFPTAEAPPTGFRIVQVPEPAALSLFALGSLLIARRRRA